MTLYLNNIPTGIVKLSFDYKNLQNNFKQLDISFGINHVPYSVAENNGLHTIVTMVNNVAVPTGVEVPNDTGTLYTRPFAPGEDINLWYTPDASGYEFQLTRVTEDPSTLAIFSTNTNYPQTPPVVTQVGGWTFLPGGLLLQYGQAYPSSSTGPQNFTVKFPRPFSVGVYNITATAHAASTTSSYVISIGITSTTQFSGFAGDGEGHALSGVPFFWTAIGR
jgi:hypothetical protein